MNKAGTARERRMERKLYRANRPVIHAFYEITRRLGPVVTVPRIGRVINDAAVARAVLMDPERFNSHGPGSFGAMITETIGPEALINMDGPAHRSLKQDLGAVFSPRYITAVVDAAAGPRLAALDAALRAGETVDFAAFMRQYGCAMACALIGITPDPEAEAAAFEDIFEIATDIMAFAGSGKPRLKPAERDAARALAARLSVYIRASYEGAEAPPHSLTARLRAQGLPFAQIRDMVSVVLIGATELVIYGLPRALAVMIDSGALPQVQRAPQRIDAAIDEALRLTTPSNAILRAVAEDSVVLGHRFRRGERLIIAFRNIMRDPALFDQPEAFDLERQIPPDLRRLMFGAGPHTCLGAALTLAEMRQVFALIAALPAPLLIGTRARNRGKLYPGYTRLDIRLDQGLVRTAAI
jgi:cytochrome P450